MTGMTGSLRLVLGLDRVGRCSLREQYCSQLHRVLQIVPGEAPEVGVVYLLNPTGGILQGDLLEADIGVDPGAHAILTTPSATKIHRSDGPTSRSRTRLRVAAGALLEYLPEPIIPFSGSKFVEELSIDLESGGRVLAWEVLAPGRTARGEAFAYDWLGLRLEVREGTACVLRERSDLRPGSEPFATLAMGSYSYYGVLLVLGADRVRVEPLIRELLDGVQAGLSFLPGTGMIVKALAEEGRVIDALFRRIRERILLEWTGRAATALRTT